MDQSLFVFCTFSIGTFIVCHSWMNGFLKGFSIEDRANQKTIRLVFSASSLSTQPQGIGIMCGSVTIYLPVRWVCFQSSPACWSSIKVTSSSFHQKVTGGPGGSMS